MADHDDRRRSGDGRPEAGGPERGAFPALGQQSLVEKEFDAPVGPGPWVQRRALGDAGIPGKQSLVEKEFGAPTRFGAPVQRRAEGTPDANTAGTAPSVGHAPSGLTRQIFDRDARRSVQWREAAAPAGSDPARVHAAAAQGVATPSSPLPHQAAIQKAFGGHDISGIQAHTGPEAAASTRAMGAAAYATGNHVVLGGSTDLHTIAHEAVHVVQQRAGVQLMGGVGAAGDAYEQHADAVADRVVAGESAAPLLDQVSEGGHSAGVVQRAPAMPASPEGADAGASHSDPATSSRLKALLALAGLSGDQQQLPTATLTIADATRIVNLLLQTHPSLVGIGPRMVAVRLMQDVVAGQSPIGIPALAQRLAAFGPIIILRPDGYIARAITGEAIQRAGKTEFVNGELRAGGLVAGTFYYSNGGVFYRASDSLGQAGPPIGELGLEHDAVNSALDGAADALVGVAAGLYQLLRHPIDSISALRQLPGAIAQLIENSPEYWELFRAKPLNDQIRDVSKLATTLATLYGGAAGTTTRIAAAAGDLGNVTIRALTLSGGGELAWATVSVPVGTVATALSGGPGAVYVLHMANSSLDKSGGGGNSPKGGEAKSSEPSKKHEEVKKEGPEADRAREQSSEHAEKAPIGGDPAPSSVRRTPPEALKEHYLKHRALLEKVLKKKYPKWQADLGADFLADLDELISSGKLRYRGKGTLKVSTPEAYIYEGDGLTLVLRQDGSFWTLLESGTGMAANIKYVR